MAKRKKILWLASWYPNKYDPFDGDFIQRHAKAAALFDDIHVIFVKESKQQSAIEEEWNYCDGLTEQIIYFPKPKSVLSKLKSYRQWQALFKRAVNAYCEKELPSIVHVQVPWKAGIIAIWIKKKYKIPFFITEHWGIYNRIVPDNIHTKSLPFRYLLKRIYKAALAFISVSKYLGESVSLELIKKKYIVIPNVVDTLLFQPSSNKYS
ncbi:MAG: glycosyltransferase, partial [Bacteroidota bacterium]|nr:glycosyltransferase [Bacteroidota bacterium]